jgi:hypothetical protein
MTPLLASFEKIEIGKWKIEKGSTPPPRKARGKQPPFFFFQFPIFFRWPSLVAAG